jgi:4a-hydroxytetrahydrobiopterin dehydratase
MPSLNQNKCVPCEGNVSPLTDREIEELLPQVQKWQMVTYHGIKQLERVFIFTDFMTALAFTNKVGELAESEGHHPALLTEWGKVTVTWWTHSIGGLHKNDFIMAAKTDRLIERG